jgi:hypothetical protein
LPLIRFIPRLFALMGVISMFFIAETASGQQVTIHGTVYNMYRTRPLDAVSVMSSSGKGTTTDSNGNYMVMVDLSDSITFSYLGRTTAKFPVAEINKNASFDIALHVNPTELNEIRIGPKNYRLDSLQNRKEYENVFNYKKPGLAITEPSSGTLGVGLDLDALINMFRFQRNRRMLAFQRRLVEEEHDKYVDHRFNRSIVKKITHLEGDELDSFMVHYRPSYEFTVVSSDYEFYDYIKLAYKEYRSMVHKKPGEMKKESGIP